MADLDGAAGAGGCPDPRQSLFVGVSRSQIEDLDLEVEGLARQWMIEVEDDVLFPQLNHVRNVLFAAPAVTRWPQDPQTKPSSAPASDAPRK